MPRLTAMLGPGRAPGRRRFAFSALLIGAFVVGTTLGPTFVSAANTAVSSVFVTNSSLAVTGTVGISGTVQTGANTVVITSGSADVTRASFIVGPAPVDLRAYKEVTLYVNVPLADPGDPGL